MRYISRIFVLYLFINGCFLSAQGTKSEVLADTKITKDTLLTKVVECNSLFTLNNRKIDRLDKKSYVYTEPYYKRIYNSEKDYAVFQIGKRRGTQPFIYIQMFAFNTCVKKDEIIEIVLDNGFTYRLKNILEPNCNGYMVSRIKRKDIKILTESSISSVKFITFRKDYEFHLTGEEAERMESELKCLKYNRFKFR